MNYQSPLECNSPLTNGKMSPPEINTVRQNVKLKHNSALIKVHSNKKVEISARTCRQSEVQASERDLSRKPIDQDGENNTGRASHQQQTFDQVPTEILDSLKNSTMKP